MKITVICENSVSIPVPKGLRAEHGLSFLLEGKNNILFDTGQFTLVDNLKRFGKDLQMIDKIILSHGHYDHTGGLEDFLKERDEPISVFLHQAAFQEKVAVGEVLGKKIEIPIGFPKNRKKYENLGANFHFVKGYTQLEDNLFTISEIERPADWESSDLRLKIKEAGQVKDDFFTDDLSILLETDSGPVVLLGCAHAGLVEILDDLSEKSGHQEFQAVLGGTHLHSASEDYLHKAVDTLKKYQVKMIAPNHCTGFKAASFLAQNFPKEFREASVGQVFEF